MTYICIATEDEPSEEVAVRIAAQVGAQVFHRFRRDGFGYLKKNVRKFAEVARTSPVLLLTDLDRAACPSSLIQEWMNGADVPNGLLFRVAVREIEAWLLADIDGLSAYLKVSSQHFPRIPDDLSDPKKTLLEIAKRSPRKIRDEMVGVRGSVSAQGLGYSARLAAFARQSWDLERAAARSPSLRRALDRLAASNLSCGCCA